MVSAARKMIVLMCRTMMAASSTITTRLAELDALTAQVARKGGAEYVEQCSLFIDASTI